MHTDCSFESYDSKLDTINEGNKIFDDDLSEVATEEMVPDMDGEVSKEDGTGSQKPNQAAASEVSFVHFFIFMIFRHIFGGPLLVKAYKQKKKSYWEKFLSLTYLGSNKTLSSKKDDADQSSKDIRRTMKLRQFKLDEGKCEVYPLLADATVKED